MSFRLVQLLFGVCVLVIWIISHGSKWTTADGDFVRVLRICMHVSSLREWMSESLYISSLLLFLHQTSLVRQRVPEHVLSITGARADLAGT